MTNIIVANQQNVWFRVKAWPPAQPHNFDVSEGNANVIAVAAFAFWPTGTPIPVTTSGFTRHFTFTPNQKYDGFDVDFGWNSVPPGGSQVDVIFNMPPWLQYKYLKPNNTFSPWTSSQPVHFLSAGLTQHQTYAFSASFEFV